MAYNQHKCWILYLSVGFVPTVQDSEAHPWSAAPPEHELHNLCQGMRGKLLVPRELYIIWDCTVLSVGFKDDFIKDCTICHFQRWLHQGLYSLPFSDMTLSRTVVSEMTSRTALSASFRDDFIENCTICQFHRLWFLSSSTSNNIIFKRAEKRLWHWWWHERTWMYLHGLWCQWW